VLYYHHTMETYGARITHVNVGTRLRRGISSTFRPLYSRGENPRCPLDIAAWMNPRASWTLQRRQTSVASAETRTPARSLVSISTELFWPPIYCHVFSDYRRVLDSLDSSTARDYTSQFTVTHRPVFSVTLLGNGFQRWTFLFFQADVLAGWPPFYTSLVTSLQTPNCN
jgi:hypothetical protein